jgi:phosphatidate cytidylyltransferase
MSETLTRFLSGVVYVTLLIVATAYSVESFYVLFGIFLIITLFEFCRILKVNFYLPIVLACVSYFLAAKYYTFKSFDLIILGFTLITSISLVSLLFNTTKNELSASAKYTYVLGYVIFPFIIISKIPFSGIDFKPKIIISVFILIWTNDTFAYIVGKSVGKHKLFEKISPKKTIEGFLGGLFFSVVASILISKFYFNPSEQHSIKSLFIWSVTAVIISVFSTLGDLIESKFKRIAGVKDSGTIMPGHGGILDRLDSIIFVAPFVFLFQQIVLDYVS